MMNQENFNALINTDSAIDPAQVKALYAVLKEFPYFQAARAVHLKGLYQNHSFSYNVALKKTAAYTTDRSVLFEYITSDEFEQHRISNRLKKRRKLVEEENDAHQVQAAITSQKEASLTVDENFEAQAEAPEIEEETPEEEASLKENSPSQQETKEAPVQFDKSEQRSFAEWLQLTKVNPISRVENEDTVSKTTPKSARENEIINTFIEKAPKIKPSKHVSHSVSLSNNEPGNHLMTETLAKIYAQQKNYDKAIQAYKILILKNPEKSGLFADRIREIEHSRENKKK